MSSKSPYEDIEIDIGSLILMLQKLLPWLYKNIDPKSTKGTLVISNVPSITIPNYCQSELTKETSNPKEITSIKRFISEIIFYLQCKYTPDARVKTVTINLDGTKLKDFEDENRLGLHKDEGENSFYSLVLAINGTTNIKTPEGESTLSPFTPAGAANIPKQNIGIVFSVKDLHAVAKTDEEIRTTLVITGPKEGITKLLEDLYESLGDAINIIGSDKLLAPKTEISQ